MATTVESVIARRVDLPGSDAELDLNTLGGRLTWARFRKNLTQRDLAKLADKVRPTIAAYESNRIVPPIDMVEKLSKLLNVSPSYIAFGEHGLQIDSTAAAEDLMTIPEMIVGRDGEAKSHVIVMSRRLIETYTANVDAVRAYVLNHDAPAFNLRSGDRIFTDTSVDEIVNEHDTYLIKTDSGMEIIRAEHLIGSNAIKLTSPKGSERNTKASALDVIGAVVGTVRQN